MRKYRKVTETILETASKLENPTVDDIKNKVEGVLGKDLWYVGWRISDLINRGKLKVKRKYNRTVEQTIANFTNKELTGNFNIKFVPIDHQLKLQVVAPCGNTAILHKTKHGVIERFMCTKHPSEGVLKFLPRSDRFIFDKAA